MVVIENSPEIVLASFGLGPAPRFLQFEHRPIHFIHVETISESCELSISPKSILTELSSCCVAIYL